MKAAVVDIETSALEAIGAGVLLCAVVRPVGRANIVFRVDDYKCRWGDERPMVRALIGELAKYDLWIGHNIIKFDYNWLRSRATFFRLPPTPRPFLYDTMLAFRRLGYKTVPNHFGKPSSGLAHVIDFFGMEQEKTGIYPRHHWDTIWGNEKKRREAMGDLVHHCEGDVRMTERIYNALLPVDYNAVIRRAR